MPGVDSRYGGLGLVVLACLRFSGVTLKPEDLEPIEDERGVKIGFKLNPCFMADCFTTYGFTPSWDEDTLDASITDFLEDFQILLSALNGEDNDEALAAQIAAGAHVIPIIRLSSS